MKQWKEYVRKVTPYTPGEQSKELDIIKLNTNENPYPPSPKVYEAIKNVEVEELRKYPDPAVSDLRLAIANRFNKIVDEVFVGVGSDDVIAMAYLTFFNSDKPILFPDITYSFYDVWADEFRVPYKKISLSEDFRVKASDYKVENGGIIIPNPNAPTGIKEPIEELEDIISSNQDSIVIIDEAYVDFGADSVVPLLDKYDNLLVVQTFSKSRSLAGSRIGYALGSPELIKCMMDVKYSFNSYTMDRVTIKLGVASIEDEEYFQDCVRNVIETREWTCKEFERLGFEYLPSASNFIFVKPVGIKADKLFEELKNRKIFVRYFNKPRIDEYLRISVGTREEMEKLISTISSIVECD